MQRPIFEAKLCIPERMDLGIFAEVGILNGTCPKRSYLIEGRGVRERDQKKVFTKTAWLITMITMLSLTVSMNWR